VLLDLLSHSFLALLESKAYQVSVVHVGSSSVRTAASADASAQRLRGPLNMRSASAVSIAASSARFAFIASASAEAARALVMARSSSRAAIAPHRFSSQIAAMRMNPRSLGAKARTDLAFKSAVHGRSRLRGDLASSSPKSYLVRVRRFLLPKIGFLLSRSARLGGMGFGSSAWLLALSHRPLPSRPVLCRSPTGAPRHGASREKTPRDSV
jgi:hypothetical protein